MWSLICWNGTDGSEMVDLVCNIVHTKIVINLEVDIESVRDHLTLLLWITLLTFQANQLGSVLSDLFDAPQSFDDILLHLSLRLARLRHERVWAAVNTPMVAAVSWSRCPSTNSCELLLELYGAILPFDYVKSRSLFSSTLWGIAVALRSWILVLSKNKVVICYRTSCLFTRNNLTALYFKYALVTRVADCRGRRVGLLVGCARQRHNLQLLNLAHRVAVSSHWIRSIGNRLYCLHLRRFSGDLMLLLLL